MPSTSHTTRIPLPIVEPVTVEQPIGENLNVNVDNFPAQDIFQNTPHYAQLNHNTLTVVWTPASGSKIHMVSFVISVDAAGYVEILDRTPPATDTRILRLDFSEKKAVPFGLNTDLDFDWDHVLVARFIGDAGTPTGYITAIGHEHTPANYPS